MSSCAACDATFERACPACGAGAPPPARFCMACGVRLDAELASPVAAGGEERRTVTVMFADLSGYTAISEALDPELLGAVLGGAMSRLAAEVRRFGGWVDKFIGDSVMALFGAPVAHEDDPQRALHAALGMQAAMREINEQFAAKHGASFDLRVGINTGEVLAGRVGEAYTVIGDAANTAQRLQAAARPGTITVGRATVDGTRGAVVYRELAPLVLKGKAEPVPAWEALGLVGKVAGEPGGPGGAGRPSADGRVGSPLVGRRDELAGLLGLAGSLGRGGAAHLATVVGQAGVGKSRLLRELELALEASGDGPRVRRGRSLPYGNNVVFWPLGEILRAECGIVDGDASGVAWSKLSARVGELLGRQGEGGEAQIALIGRLLGVEAPVEVESPSGLGAQRMRETFFATVRSIVEGIAGDEPLILAWEDIHWADEGMLDLIEYLASSLRKPVLQICLAREELLERRPSWAIARRNATTIFVDPLGEGETVELISGLVGDRTSASLIATLAERAGGNPLFAEELVRRLEEEGPGAAAELPHTVQALLAARLDSLGSLERRVLAHAAVVGQTFWAGALVDVRREAGEDLEAALARLGERDLIVSGDGGLLAGEPELAFRHVLIRDVAYRMLPKSVRARKHFEVGRFIEARAGERADEVVALLAEHFDRAAQLGGEVKLPAAILADYRAQALGHLEAAGDAARVFYSNDEALTRYESARAYADGDEEVATRIDEKRGDVLVSLGRVDQAIGLWNGALVFRRGGDDAELVAGLHRRIGAALALKGERREAIAHHQEGIRLIRDGAPSPVLVSLYEEAAWLYMETGDNMLAIYSAEKALQLAEQTGEPGAASRARGIFGRIFGRIGDTVKARENLEQAVELARTADGRETVLALLALGHHLESSEAEYGEARAVYEEGLLLAREIGEVPAQIELLAGLAQLALYACDWTSARTSCEAAVRLGERDGLSGKLCLPYAQLGILRWRAGDWESSEVELRRAHALAAKVGSSEAAFTALHGLALTLYDRGELARAEAAVLGSLVVCEHAGLVAQSIEAAATRALVLSAAGSDAEASALAHEAWERAGRMEYPVGRAAALEAIGVVGDLPDGLDQLAAASEAWAAVGRPLEQSRCQLELGRRLCQSDLGRGTAVLLAAADSFERLGVVHVAARTRRFARGVVG
ncbi:MAG TPA: adenylate/guanylate cyclase domain-containing protein [Solirubrobacteraceae bacterium]